MLNPLIMIIPFGLLFLLSKKKTDATGTIDVPLPGGGRATGTIDVPPWTPGTTPGTSSGGNWPGIPPQPNLQAEIQAAIASRSVEDLLRLATIVEGYDKNAASNLRAIAKSIKDAANIDQNAIDAATKILNTIPQGPPLGGTGTSSVPNNPATGGGIAPPSTQQFALAKQVQNHLATSKKGAENKRLLASYQVQEGVKADGLYGPGTALTFLKYAIVPVPPFYWPANAASAKRIYIDSIKAVAKSNPSLSAQLNKMVQSIK